MKNALITLQNTTDLYTADDKPHTAGVTIGTVLVSVVIFAKVTLIISFFVMGIRAHQARAEKVTFVVYIMGVYIVAMLGLAVYEFFFEKVMLLYYVLLLCVLGQAFQVQILLNKARRFQVEKNQTKGKCVLIFLYTMYALQAVVGVTPTWSAHCRAKMRYPMCMHILMICVYILFGTSTYLYQHNYFIDEVLLKDFEDEN